MRQTSKHRQIQCLNDLSNNVINNSANEKIIFGGDYNCALRRRHRDIYKRGGGPTSHKTWRCYLGIELYTWSCWCAVTNTCRCTRFHVEKSTINVDSFSETHGILAGTMRYFAKIYFKRWRPENMARSKISHRPGLVAPGFPRMMQTWLLRFSKKTLNT